MPDRNGQHTRSATLHREMVTVRDLLTRVRPAGVAWQTFGDVARDLHLTDDELAGALGNTRESIESVSRVGELSPEGAEDLATRIGALAQLYAHLLDTFRSPEAIPLWMRAESRYLAGQRPADVLREGRIGRVEAALEALDYGAFV